MTAEITIEGMACGTCENHVQMALNEVDGVIEAMASFKNGNTIVKFDKSKTSLEALATTVEDKTVYKVKEYKVIEDKA